VKRIRERARKVIRRLRDLGDGANIREGVRIVLSLAKPTINWQSEDLEPNRPDDRILAYALEHIRQSGKAHVLVVTADFGLQLKCQQRGLLVKELREKLYEAPPDSEERKIKKLEEKLARARERIPKVSLMFPGELKESEFIAFELRKLEDLTDADIVHDQESVRQKLSKIRYPIGVLRQDVERYRRQLDKHIEKHGEFFKTEYIWRRRQNLTVSLPLVLVNNGTAPAEDIDIELRFSGNYDVLRSEDLPPKPEPPAPPKPPQSLLDKLTVSTNLSSLIANAFRRPSVNPVVEAALAIQAPVKGPSIEKIAAGHRVCFHVRSLKHHMDLELSDLFIVFPSFEKAESFGFKYDMVISNHPEKKEGELHVRIEKHC
jgi:hypothetical protein